MIGFAAGWHAHLDSLTGWLRDAPGSDRDARYVELEPLYRARIMPTF